RGQLCVLGLRQFLDGRLEQEVGQVALCRGGGFLDDLPRGVVDPWLTHSGTLRSLSGKGEDQHVSDRLPSSAGGEAHSVACRRGAVRLGPARSHPRCDRCRIGGAPCWLPAGNRVRRGVPPTARRSLSMGPGRRRGGPSAPPGTGKPASPLQRHSRRRPGRTGSAKEVRPAAQSGVGGLRFVSAVDCQAVPVGAKVEMQPWSTPKPAGFAVAGAAPGVVPLAGGAVEGAAVVVVVVGGTVVVVVVIGAVVVVVGSTGPDGTEGERSV